MSRKPFEALLAHRGGIPRHEDRPAERYERASSNIMADRQDRPRGPTGKRPGGPKTGFSKRTGGPQGDRSGKLDRSGKPDRYGKPDRSGKSGAARPEKPKGRIFDEAGREVLAQCTSYSGRMSDERAPRPEPSAPRGGPDKRFAGRTASSRDKDKAYGNRQRGDILRRDSRPEHREDLPALPIEPPRKYVYRDAGEKPAGTSGAKGLDRIAKVMARAGLCSRRDAEEWIHARRVSVNGKVIESPALDVSPTDRILVDGAPLPVRERTRLWLFHKPTGLVTTESDPEGRPTVFDNLPAGLPRVVSIGRLDINTEGLLLLTNDGGLARVLGHPTTGWLRRYRVRVNGKVAPSMIEELRAGVSVDGVDYEPIIATLDRSKGANAWLTLDLSEGKNREVKRVLEHFGLLVTRLIRISFGPFQLGELAEGEAEEVRSRTLRDQLGDRLAAEAEVDFEAPRFEHDAGDEPPARPQRKRYDARKPSEKRALIESGEASGLEMKRERFSTRKGRVVEVERIAARQPSAESLGTGRVLWRRDGKVSDADRGEPQRGERSPRETRAPRREAGAAGPRVERSSSRPNERKPRWKADAGSLADSKSYGGRSTSGKGVGKPAAGRPDGPRAGKPPGRGKSFGGGFSAGGKSFGERPVGGSPVGGRPAGERPARGRPTGGRPAGGKPSGNRPGGRPGSRG